MAELNKMLRDQTYSQLRKYTLNPYYRSNIKYQIYFVALLNIVFYVSGLDLSSSLIEQKVFNIMRPHIDIGTRALRTHLKRKI